MFRHADVVCLNDNVFRQWVKKHTFEQLASVANQHHWSNLLGNAESFRGLGL